jgi:hypothetical protein
MSTISLSYLTVKCVETRVFVMIGRRRRGGGSDHERSKGFDVECEARLGNTTSLD